MTETVFDTNHLILFDPSTMKVGCVLLQAAYGGSSAAANYLGSQHWFIEPTDDMAVYETTPEQLKMLKEILDHG